MLNQNYTAELLNLEDVIVTKVENIESEVHIFLELPKKKHICPNCSKETDRIHDYREQIVKDIPLGRTTYLHLRKRRYACPHCKKRFFENNPFLPRYYRMTSRLIASIISSFRKLVPASEIAHNHNVSITTAFRYFDYINYQCKSLPHVLSIDEFKGNAGGQKYQSIITDPKNRKILDILPNRFESDLIKYFKGFSTRNNVNYFVIDMNSHFKAVANTCFPNATIVVDRYHVSRQVLWAMENVRKNEQKKLSDHFRKYFKRSRYLLTKSHSTLSDKEKEQLALMFEIAPRLARAYDLKNRFLNVMHSPNSTVGRKLLSDWLFIAEFENIPEFSSCITAYRNWFHEILNSLDVPWSNGFTEGCNNKTKVLKRVCFGVRNFNRFKNRILHCST